MYKKRSSSLSSYTKRVYLSSQSKHEKYAIIYSLSKKTERSRSVPKKQSKSVAKSEELIRQKFTSVVKPAFNDVVGSKEQKPKSNPYCMKNFGKKKQESQLCRSSSQAQLIRQSKFFCKQDLEQMENIVMVQKKSKSLEGKKKKLDALDKPKLQNKKLR